MPRARLRTELLLTVRRRCGRRWSMSRKRSFEPLPKSCSRMSWGVASSITTNLLSARSRAPLRLTTTVGHPSSWRSPRAYLFSSGGRSHDRHQEGRCPSHSAAWPRRDVGVALAGRHGAGVERAQPNTRQAGGPPGGSVCTERDCDAELDASCGRRRVRAHADSAAAEAIPGPTAGPDRAQQHAFFWPARRPCAVRPPGS